jgi:hypothetical protein
MLQELSQRTLRPLVALSLTQRMMVLAVLVMAVAWALWPASVAG